MAMRWRSTALVPCLIALLVTCGTVMAGGEAADRSPQTVIVFVRDMEFNSLPDAEVEMLFGKDGAVKPVVLPDGSYMATGTGEKVGVSILHPTAGGASVCWMLTGNPRSQPLRPRASRTTASAASSPAVPAVAGSPSRSAGAPS